ncbi:hypothetical protein KKA47_06745 [bacterium]|nr:hypothetical protein [bacterium]
MPGIKKKIDGLALRQDDTHPLLNGRAIRRMLIHKISENVEAKFKPKWGGFNVAVKIRF